MTLEAEFSIAVPCQPTPQIRPVNPAESDEEDRSAAPVHQEVVEVPRQGLARQALGDAVAVVLLFRGVDRRDQVLRRPYVSMGQAKSHA